MGETIFSKILSGEIPSDPVYSDEEFYAFRDIHPAAPIHILLIPRKPIPRITDITEEDIPLIGKMFLIANHIAEKEGLTKKGFRYVINCDEWGGQTVFHLHLHILGGRPMSWPPG